MVGWRLITGGTLCTLGAKVRAPLGGRAMGAMLGTLGYTIGGQVATGRPLRPGIGATLATDGACDKIGDSLGTLVYTMLGGTLCTLGGTLTTAGACDQDGAALTRLGGMLCTLGAKVRAPLGGSKMGGMLCTDGTAETWTLGATLMMGAADRVGT